MYLYDFMSYLCLDATGSSGCWAGIFVIIHDATEGDGTKGLGAAKGLGAGHCVTNHTVFPKTLKVIKKLC